MSTCPHPKDHREPTMLNPENHDLAYCSACRCVIRRVDGDWVPDSVPGQITKAVMRRG